MKAVWNGATIAEASEVISVEGFTYFPTASVDHSYLQAADTNSVCFWKGGASYFDVVVNGAINCAAAWTYEEPLVLAQPLHGHVAFWRGVEIVGDGDVMVMEPPTPLIANALGDVAVWQPDLGALGLRPDVGQHRFSGYYMPTIHALVDVMPQPAEAAWAEVVQGADEFGNSITARNIDADAPLGYIAVWGSHLPDLDTIARLRQGSVIIELGR
jgi:uncharacterized protein (DUF427 family)